MLVMGDLKAKGRSRQARQGRHYGEKKIAVVNDNGTD